METNRPATGHLATSSPPNVSEPKQEKDAQQKRLNRVHDQRRRQTRDAEDGEDRCEQRDPFPSRDRLHLIGLGCGGFHGRRLFMLTWWHKR